MWMLCPECKVLKAVETQDKRKDQALLKCGHTRTVTTLGLVEEMQYAEAQEVIWDMAERKRRR